MSRKTLARTPPPTPSGPSRLGRKRAQVLTERRLFQGRHGKRGRVDPTAFSASFRCPQQTSLTARRRTVRLSACVILSCNRCGVPSGKGSWIGLQDDRDRPWDERARVDAGRSAASSARRSLRIAVHTLAGGARVVDAGVDVPGGFAARPALAELCMGGLGHVEFASLTIGGETWPGVHVWTDHPAESLHGVAVRRVGDQSGGVLRDGLGPAAREGARGEGAVRKARLRRGRATAACSCSRGARCRPMTSPPGWPARRASRPSASRSRSRRRRASPAACRSSRGSSRRGCTRWTRSAST